MGNSEYKELFISESKEILAKLSKFLVNLEKDPENSWLLNEIFRCAHTLKGMAASMGYDDIIKLSHSMEGVLDLLRSRQLKVEREIINLIFEAFDSLGGLISAVEREETDGSGLEGTVNIAPVVQKLSELASQAPVSKKEAAEGNEERRMLRLEDEDRVAILQAAKEGISTYKVTVVLNKSCKMKQVRAFMVLKTVEELGQIIKKRYIENQIKSGRFDRYCGFFFMTKESPQLIQEKVAVIPEVERINMELLDAIELLVPQAKDGKGEEKEKKRELKKSPEIQTVRVAVERLNNLMNLAGELTINKIRLLNVGIPLGNKALNESFSQLSRLSIELQSEIMLVRLVPIGYILDRFPRMVRDLGAEEGKEVNLEIEGSEIGLDRTILDEINDPLIHLLRNAVSHGIEDPEERLRRGKSRAGQIQIVAKKERNFVSIEVSDDGRGMDGEEIKRVAVAKNMITEEEVSKLSDSDVTLLITTAGFSTSKKVTETSGRGVGMNTVLTKVESLGGSLTIVNMASKGAKFTLKLPVSMAVLQALLVQIETEVYAIPLTNISRTIKIESSLIQTMEHHEMVPYGEEVLPLVRLKEKFGFGSATLKDGLGEESVLTMEKRIPVVVVEVGDKKAGFIVDKLLGQQEVVIKALSEELKGVQGVAGATILGDGKVALIVDVPFLLQRGES